MQYLSKDDECTLGATLVGGVEGGTLAALAEEEVLALLEMQKEQLEQLLGMDRFLRAYELMQVMFM